MAQIWKFPIGPSAPDLPCAVRMPRAAEILSTSFQGGALCIWAKVEPDAEKVERRFLVIGTGWEFRQDGRFIGTAFHPTGLVFHVFDVTA